MKIRKIRMKRGGEKGKMRMEREKRKEKIKKRKVKNDENRQTEQGKTIRKE